MMSCAMERPVNKQTIYRWPLNRLCFQVVVPDPAHRCCFPRAAVPRSSASCRGNLPYLLQLHFRFSKPVCFLPSPPHPRSQGVLISTARCSEEQAAVPVILCVRFVFVPARIPRNCKVAPALPVSQQACFAFTDTWGVTD